ncbi:uncharacterized protein LOC106719657 isoform X1 [Papilio machaon]|uniref:uncharacterized protein LOC106719657 isoform X1 n=1 Tax=Papilio machaon TaxID=76193 RepID=UPI001E664EAE|nr:uncharacterized protein LOC106719657 isoform X1 [Papilio machaon]
MKKVRFETSLNNSAMNDLDCQSPRPYLEKKSISDVPCIEYDFARVLPYNNDPLQRYECGNGSPYPTINKTCLTELSKIESKWTPSNDLDLSLLDTYAKMPRSSFQDTNMFKHQTPNGPSCVENNICNNVNPSSRVLTSLENKYQNPPNTLNKNDDFFLQRNNLHQMSCQNIESQFKKFTLYKENNPLAAKNELIKIGVTKPLDKVSCNTPMDAIAVPTDHCQCHQCTRTQVFATNCVSKNIRPCGYIQSSLRNINCCNKPCCKQISNQCEQCNCKIPICTKNCKKCACDSNYSLDNDINAVDKKTWALKKYEESNSDTLNAEKQLVKEKGKEKREPSVADLFKIIKLQNEQLQLLQEKVDKFISTSKFEMQKQTLPIQNYATEHVAVQAMDKEHHKISIGVMTSFEVVRTSTIINKEILTQCSEAQIQCNRSQISIKEVQPVHLNFLDGITPVSKTNEGKQNTPSFEKVLPIHTENCNKDCINDEKTYNEMSLYNVQVDNAITPLMSPEQSMYLDVRDYSDSESEPEDQSNVGWTYYNKVMAHVNGMLHDSDMPSSASALYRNTRQKCMQMKIDKTNVSVIKRVKFGDDPIVPQQQVLTASTDTSLKMKQLAAKYLKNGHVNMQAESLRPSAPIDMSFATRNYMEKHQLLQGIPMKSSNGHVPVEMPRFLDITALKQQPKLL